MYFKIFNSKTTENQNPPPLDTDKGGMLDTKAHSYVSGFDYLRVICMLSVLFSHHYIANNMLTEWHVNTGSRPDILEYINFHIRACSVPVFTLISLVIFVRKNRTFSDLKKRLIALGYLYVFWVSAWILVSRVRPEPNFLGVVEFLYRGGGWLFYFIPSLAVCTSLAWFGSKLRYSTNVILFVVALLLNIFVFNWLHNDYKWLHKTYYWLPSAFVSSAFISNLIAPYISKIRSGSIWTKWVVIGLLAAGLGCACIEWQFAAPQELAQGSRLWLPWHNRCSVQFTAAAFLIIGICVKRNPGCVVRNLSKNSLGIYCIHAFLLGGIIRIAHHLLGELNPMAEVLIGYFAVVVVCNFATELLRKAFQHRLV